MLKLPDNLISSVFIVNKIRIYFKIATLNQKIQAKTHKITYTNQINYRISVGVAIRIILIPYSRSIVILSFTLIFALAESIKKPFKVSTKILDKIIIKNAIR
jgi:hypothetical protein